MGYARILHSVGLMCGVIASTATVQASDLLGPLDWTFKDVAAVEAHCAQRLALVARQREAAESLPLDSDSLVLLRAYDRVYGAVRDAGGEVWVLSELAPQSAIRKAAAKCYERLEVARVNLQHSEPLFERLLAAQTAGVPEEFRYILARQIDAFRRNGVNRDAATRARLETLSKRIAGSISEFQDNIDTDVPTIEITSNDLDGLSAEARSRLPAAKDGRVRIPIDEMTASPILNYSDNESLRKKTLKALNNVGWPANDAVLKRLSADRAELAKLLGFDTYARYQLAGYMVRTPENLQAFMDRMASDLRIPSSHFINRILAQVRVDNPAVERLPEWSVLRALSQLEKEGVGLDYEEVRRYLSYQSTRDGLFELTKDLFGVRIRTWSTKVWAPTVEAYEMLDGDRIIGRFYLDPFPREGKHKLWRVARIRVGTKTGPIPEAVLIANTESGRISHFDVVTFFHEYGHLLHQMLSGQVELAMQASRDMENDAIEAPSQVFEAWAWDYETLKRFARDEKGQPIPRPLVERLNASRALSDAYVDMYELAGAAVSLDFCSRDLADVDLTTAYFSTLKRYLDLETTPDTHPQAAFSHLGEMGCAYYTYIWSKVLAVDLLTRFRKEGLRNSATAAAYRDAILARGGSESMNALTRQFLGRNWSVEAYVERMKSAASHPPSVVP
jgi:thimet oligopeptidase